VWVRLSGPDRLSKARLQLLSRRTKVVAQTLNRQILKLPSSVVTCARSVLEPLGSPAPEARPENSSALNTRFRTAKPTSRPGSSLVGTQSFPRKWRDYLPSREAAKEYSPRREPWVSGENMNKPRYGAKENAMTQIPEEPPSPLPSNSQTGKHHRPFPRGVSVHLERKPASMA
jgi:hypothetical protein